LYSNKEEVVQVNPCAQKTKAKNGMKLHYWIEAGRGIETNLSKEQVLEGVKRKVKSFGYEWKDVTGSSRIRHVVDIRHLTQFYLYKNGWNYTKVAQLMGKNHATIIHSVKKCSELISVDKDYKEMWTEYRVR